MNTLITLFSKLSIGVFAVFGIISVLLLAYYYPVIDRLANLCAYYPQAFVNCNERDN